MNDERADAKIFVDSDWKEEAAREKKKLDEQTRDAGGAGNLPPASLAEIINLVAMQGMVAMGGYRSPSGETLPPDLAVAKHYIDLLGVLQEKTKGNLTEDERRALDGVAYEMRMQYVQAVAGPPRESVAGLADPFAEVTQGIPGVPPQTARQKS